MRSTTVTQMAELALQTKNWSPPHSPAETIAKYDLLLLATDHTKFDYELLQQHAKLIVDTRGIY